jgi:hypothetical protein
MALSVAPRVKFCASVSNRMTTRASSVSPRDATSRNGSVPTTGYPTTVVSTAANVSSSVSTATTFCSGHSDGHPVAIRALPDYDALFGIDLNDFNPTAAPAAEASNP